MCWLICATSITSSEISYRKKLGYLASHPCLTERFFYIEVQHGAEAKWKVYKHLATEKCQSKHGDVHRLRVMKLWRRLLSVKLNRVRGSEPGRSEGF